MNVAADREEKKNENTGKKEAGEKKKQATDFRESEYCHSAVAQRSAQRKMSGCENARGNWDLSETPTAFSTHPTRGRGLRHYVKVAFDWCRSKSLSMKQG